ncbi:hypothetical protein LXA43DRAFT_320644 [Ganoderma leucocontextum]|nr:hypothetical protein LXA43DRAFT_320644 [Ganoderma leucocontextum]
MAISNGKRLNDASENTPFFVNVGNPPAKRPRRVLQPVGAEGLRELQHQLVQERRDREEARTEGDTEKGHTHEEAVERQKYVNGQLKHVVKEAKDAGFGTLHDFLTSLFATTDQQLSAQVSRTIGTHGSQLLSSMSHRQPALVSEWAEDHVLQRLQEEGRKLIEHLRRPTGQDLTEMLAQWSFQDVLKETEDCAPTLWRILRLVGGGTKVPTDGHSGSTSARKDRDLIFGTVIAMLACAANQRSNELQSVLCIYLLACGATRSQFEVLNHAGLACSYSTAVSQLRQLSEERLAMIHELVRRFPCMLVWDNLNIAFRVGEQRADSKDHFDNGTTATIIPLYDVPYGSLSLDLKPPRDTRLPVLDFGPQDLLPTAIQVQQLECDQLWHLEDILLDFYPALRARLGDALPEGPNVLAIPLHKTEQYPLPAMHIDESSLAGTIDVMDTIIRKTLKLSEAEVRKHGLFICAGDQLSVSLLDKASASRRDDVSLLDNLSQYTIGQLGLFHVKMAADRMVTNEFWGRPNGKSPWSLWRMNTVLGRKAISAGWKAKKLPPFRPSWELIIRLVLPANILDAYRVCCPADDLDRWVANLDDHTALRRVTVAVRDQLCSSRRVSTLRKLHDSERDVPLENIVLFNRDALLLRQFAYAVKRGDIGTVVNVLSIWKVTFRGTGSMNKYADALFHTLVSLERMDPKLRQAFLMNWLVNLTGQPNAWKEVDLLEEHQNFWAKIIYNAKGSNRTWKWLSMVTVVIFVLRDIIRQVQRGYKTPHNGQSHTSPSAQTDITTILTYLKDHTIQEYTPGRAHNDSTLPARDLLVQGAQYPSTASAFKTFRPVYSDVSYKAASSQTQAHDVESEDDDETAEVIDPVATSQDFGASADMDELDMSDIFDDEELPPGMDTDDLVATVRELCDELHFDE